MWEGLLATIYKKPSLLFLWDDSREGGGRLKLGTRVEKDTNPWMGEVRVHGWMKVEQYRSNCRERRRKPKPRMRGSNRKSHHINVSTDACFQGTVIDSDPRCVRLVSDRFWMASRQHHSSSPVTPLPTIRQFSGCMEYPQDFDPFQARPNAIRHDIPCFWNDKFVCSRQPTWMAKRRVISQ